MPDAARESAHFYRVFLCVAVSGALLVLAVVIACGLGTTRSAGVPTLSQLILETPALGATVVVAIPLYCMAQLLVVVFMRTHRDHRRLVAARRYFELTRASVALGVLQMVLFEIAAYVTSEEGFALHVSCAVGGVVVTVGRACTLFARRIYYTEYDPSPARRYLLFLNAATLVALAAVSLATVSVALVAGGTVNGLLEYFAIVLVVAIDYFHALDVSATESVDDDEDDLRLPFNDTWLRR